jgi:hypothetical protein
MCGIGGCGGAKTYAPYTSQTSTQTAAGGSSAAANAATQRALQNNAAQASVGAGMIGNSVMQHVDPKNGHVGTMVDRRVNGQVANRPKSQQVYDVVRQLIARYPTVDALRAAGADVPANPKGGDHIKIPAGNDDLLRQVKDSDTWLEWLVIENDGTVGSAQITQKTSATPPQWGGIWGNHDTGKAFMTHVYANRPIDEAFAH